MKNEIQSSVLLYGKSRYFDIFRKELSGNYGFPIVYIDPSTPEAVNLLRNQEARLFVYEKDSVNIDLVSAFLLRNPDIPVVCLGSESKPDVEVTFRKYSRIETSGLPQMLQVLEDRWDA